MPRRALLGLALLACVLAAPGADTPPPVPRDSLPANLALNNIPPGLDPRPVPADSPLTADRVRLGRRLFFDPVLSADRTVACASCHQPDHGFASAGGRPRGIHGQQTARRAPSLFNRAYGTSFFWDGRAATLEEQALQPIDNPAELGAGAAEAVRRLDADRDYRRQFEVAFPDGVTAGNLARALASFERVLLRGGSRVDRFQRGDVAALTEAERHGLWLYESKGGCWRCHRGPNYTDEQYHNTGVGWGKEPLDLGRYAVTHNDADRGRFKTPTLRGVALTGPFMHDGSLATLQDVVAFYNKGGGANPHRDPALAPLGLTGDEVRDLIAFLEAL